MRLLQKCFQLGVTLCSSWGCHSCFYIPGLIAAGLGTGFEIVVGGLVAGFGFCQVTGLVF